MIHTNVVQTNRKERTKKGYRRVLKKKQTTATPQGTSTETRREKRIYLKTNFTVRASKLPFLQCIRENQFYIITHLDQQPQLKTKIIDEQDVEVRKSGREAK